MIGINYSRFHVGESKVKGTLVARKSPLGGVIFGSNAEDLMTQIKQVSIVRLVQPVDMTDVWKTESLGVSIAPCTCEGAKLSAQEREELKLIEESCQLQENKWIMKYPWKRSPSILPNNYVQVRKKLESLERRLMKDPENASSYNNQIQGMETMQFARQLSPKGLTDWKGPIHYVSHHAVIRPERKRTSVRIAFNSSASYNGHTLNDYWFKGPDLLNDLFGVVIRFRENPYAICGDIAKMYHMIAIPEEDQHVHGFLWRNYEVDREKDTYVKTVLTFGDRPAPTMAITAMQKTANMKKEGKPRAAEAILKNPYVDDICDSVNNVQEAKALMSDIDKVLDVGGFHVKQCISSEQSDVIENPSEVAIGGESLWLPQEDMFTFKI